MTPQPWDDSSSIELEELSVPSRQVRAERSSLISLRFLLSAIRRRRAAIAFCAVIGLLAGAAVAQLTKVKTVATASVLLTRDPSADPDRAVATDIALAQTNDVAGTVASQLHLKLTPQQFAKTITVKQVTDDVLRISVSGPDEASAKLRANDVVNTFLAFRAKTLSLQSNAVIDGLRQQIQQLNAQVATLTSKINATNSDNTSALTDLVSQRTQATSQINTLESQVGSDVLAISSITSTSRMLDPATVAPTSKLKRLVTDAAGGLIVGILLAMLVVAIAATLSWRIRRREDASDAIDAPVRSVRSTRKLTPEERHLLVRLVEQSCEDGKAAAWVANGTLKVSAKLLVTVARDMQSLGHKVLLVDLAPGRPLRRAAKMRKSPERRHRVERPVVERNRQRIRLHRRRWRPRHLAGLIEDNAVQAAKLQVLRQQPVASAESAHQLDVLTPDVQTVLKSGPLHPSSSLLDGSGDAVAYAGADIILVLATVDPAVGAEYLREWADTAILTIGAGECTPESVHTAAELLRIAGIPVSAGILMQADRTDESLGLPVAAQSDAMVRSAAP